MLKADIYGRNTIHIAAYLTLPKFYHIHYAKSTSAPSATMTDQQLPIIQQVEEDQVLTRNAVIEMVGNCRTKPAAPI